MPQVARGGSRPGAGRPVHGTARKQSLGVFTDPDTREKLRLLAQKEGVSMNVYVERLIANAWHVSPLSNPLPIVVVACSAGKTDRTCKARDLYQSDLFKKSARLAQAMVADGKASAWYILSAEHGLLHPDAVIAPYDTCLRDLTNRQFLMWSMRVAHQLNDVRPCGVIALAGSDYRKALAEYCQDHGITMQAPMEGLGIGQQKAWLAAQL